MNPDSRMAISLVLSLLVSADNLRLAASGEADIVTVGVRYVVAFLLAFMVVGIIGRMVNGYVRAQHQDEAEPVEQPVERRSSDGTFGRRSQDRSPESDSRGGFDAPVSESLEVEEAPGSTPMRFLDHDSDAA